MVLKNCSFFQKLFFLICIPPPQFQKQVGTAYDVKKQDIGPYFYSSVYTHRWAS